VVTGLLPVIFFVLKQIRKPFLLRDVAPSYNPPMKTIFTTAGAGVPYRIIPDIQIHLDGLPILSYSYSIYKGSYDAEHDYSYAEAKLHIEDSNDPDYMGSVTLEEPDNIFSYAPNGNSELAQSEITELIKVIEHYHEHPLIWYV
jgi:hypothetical protein